jgi:hypothetical protein
MWQLQQTQAPASALAPRSPAEAVPPAEGEPEAVAR